MSKSTDANEVDIDDTESVISYTFPPNRLVSYSFSCCMKLRFGEMTPRRKRTCSKASSKNILFLNMR